MEIKTLSDYQVKELTLLFNLAEVKKIGINQNLELIVEYVMFEEYKVKTIPMKG